MLLIAKRGQSKKNEKSRTPNEHLKNVQSKIKPCPLERPEVSATSLPKLPPYTRNEIKTKNFVLLPMRSAYHWLSDPMLKGFGACTRLKNGNHLLEYILLQEKGLR